MAMKELKIDTIRLRKQLWCQCRVLRCNLNSYSRMAVDHQRHCVERRLPIAIRYTRLSNHACTAEANTQPFSRQAGIEQYVRRLAHWHVMDAWSAYVWRGDESAVQHPSTCSNDLAISNAVTGFRDPMSWWGTDDVRVSWIKSVTEQRRKKQQAKAIISVLLIGRSLQPCIILSHAEKHSIIHENDGCNHGTK